MDDARQVALIDTSNSRLPTSELWPQGLRKLLLEGEDSGGACRLIAINPTLRRQCEEMLPQLERAKEVATEEEILMLLVRHAPAYGVHAKSPGEWSALFDSYLNILNGLPLYAIEDAFLRWGRGEGHKDVRMAGFYPKAPQLFLLAEKGKAEVWTAAYRARKALEHVEKTGVEWTPERKAEERQKMIDAGYLNADGSPNLSLGPKGMPEPHRPRLSPQELAAQLRATDAAARHGGAPISRHHIQPPVDDVGDVL